MVLVDLFWLCPFAFVVLLGSTLSFPTRAMAGLTFSTWVYSAYSSSWPSGPFSKSGSAWTSFSSVLCRDVSSVWWVSLSMPSMVMSKETFLPTIFCYFCERIESSLRLHRNFGSISDSPGPIVCNWIPHRFDNWEIWTSLHGVKVWFFSPVGWPCRPHIQNMWCLL